MAPWWHSNETFSAISHDFRNVFNLCILMRAYVADWLWMRKLVWLYNMRGCLEISTASWSKHTDMGWPPRAHTNFSLAYAKSSCTWVFQFDGLIERNAWRWACCFIFVLRHFVSPNILITFSLFIFALIFWVRPELYVRYFTKTNTNAVSHIACMNENGFVVERIQFLCYSSGDNMMAIVAVTGFGFSCMLSSLTCIEFRKSSN